VFLRRVLKVGMSKWLDMASAHKTHYPFVCLSPKTSPKLAKSLKSFVQ
jgi:hypothetical protein